MDYRNMTIPAFPPQSRKELALSRTIPNDRKPVWVYIVDRLGPGSIKTMLRALDTIARIASGGTDGVVTFRWPELRYKHTSAIRSTLAARYKPAMANKMLSAQTRYEWASTCYFPVLTGGVVTGPASRLPDGSAVAVAPAHGVLIESHFAPSCDHTRVYRPCQPVIKGKSGVEGS
jgi:hypothetical protein